MKNPLQNLDSVRATVRDVLNMIEKSVHLGSTTALVKGAKAQIADGWPTIIVTGSHEYSEVLGRDKDLRAVCVQHLIAQAHRNPPGALIFDNHAIANILRDVDSAITKVFESCIPSHQNDERVPALQKSLAEADSASAKLMVTLDKALNLLNVLDALVEDQGEEIKLLLEQVQVTTRALGDAQRHATEPSA